MMAPLFAQLLAAFGPRAFDLAISLIQKWESPTPLTVADVEAARKLGERTARDAMIEALVRSGVALDSPQAVTMLALVP